MADDISLKQFIAMDPALSVSAFVPALEAFDTIPSFGRSTAIAASRPAAGIDDLTQRQALFGTVGYFLFTTRT